MTAPEEIEEQPSVLDEGSTVEFAEWRFKVNEVQVHNTIGEEVARGKFLVLIVEATNGSNVQRQFGDLALLLIDETGRTFEMHSSASLAHHHAYGTDTWHLEDIGPSLKGVMPIAFDVAKDVSAGAFGASSRGSSSLSPFVRVSAPAS